MIVILSAQVLNHSSLQDNGHGLACKLRGFASGGNGHGPVEQTEEVNIQIPATGHENERVHMCIVTNRFVILSAQALNRSSLQGNGHWLAYKSVFTSGGNGHGPVEQTEEINILNSATGHENDRVYSCISNEITQANVMSNG